jgi:hypothetical protein
MQGPFLRVPTHCGVERQGPGLDAKKRVCRNLSKGDLKVGVPAVNEYIDKEDFLTRFDMPSKVANLVSLQSPSLSSFSVFLSFVPTLHQRPGAR